MQLRRGRFDQRLENLAGRVDGSPSKGSIQGIILTVVYYKAI